MWTPLSEFFLLRASAIFEQAQAALGLASVVVESFDRKSRNSLLLGWGLVATEEVAGVNFVLNIIKDGIVAVGDDGVALGLEGCKVVDHQGTEEGAAIGKSRFVDDDLGSFGLDTFHDALYGALAEVVGA